MDDVRAGRLLRALRRRARLTQKALGARVGVSQQEISLLERGHLEAVQLRTIRLIFRGLDAAAELDIRWRGGAIDRLLDARHATLVGLLSELLSSDGWQILPEITYNHFGDRGSIDLVAWHPSSATLLVIEVKTELTSIEATLRKHDEKARLAPEVVAERWGWRPRAVARVLVMPDHRTARRQVERADATLKRTYPLRGWDVRHWIKRPSAQAAPATGCCSCQSPPPVVEVRRSRLVRAIPGPRSSPGAPRTTRDGGWRNEGRGPRSFTTRNGEWRNVGR